MRIWAVRVEGAPHTRTSFLASIINPSLSSGALPSPSTQLSPSDVPPVETLESALHATRRISDVLIRSDIFSSVQPTLERSRDPLAQFRDVDLVIRCRERSRFFLKTATEIGNNEGTAVSIEIYFGFFHCLFSFRAQQLAFVTYLVGLKIWRPQFPSARKLGKPFLLHSLCPSRPLCKPMVYFLCTPQNATCRDLQVAGKPLRVSGLLSR